MDKLYKIKPIEWKGDPSMDPISFHRYSTKAFFYHSYSIFRFKKPDGEWSKWNLQIRLDNRKFFPYPKNRNIGDDKYDTFEEAEKVAQNHHESFVKQFLEEV